MDFEIRDRVALVCGGSSGLGYAVAEALLAEGARIALNGRDPGKLDDAVRRLGASAAAGRVAGFPADVSRPGAAAALVERVHHEMGGPDILL